MLKWIMWLSILFIVVGIVLMAIYGIEHFDKKNKTTRNQGLIAGGAALLVIGVAILLFGLFYKPKPKAPLLDKYL
jgi:hypothetical protein